MPKFSIISPVYNTSEYLDKFLNSVLTQSFGDFELILVDDGSTDGSLNICKEYANKDNRITVLTQQNQGAGPARNNGIANACGDYLLFFDSDDWVNIKTLEILNQILSEYDVDLLIYGGEEVVYSKDDEELRRIPTVPQELNLITERSCRDAFCDLIFTSIINVPWNKVYKRELVNKYHVEFADTRRAQDAFFNMDYYRHIERLYSIQDILYYYRGNDQQKVWKKFPKDLYKIDIKYDAYMVDIFTKFGIYDGEQREKVDTLFYNSIYRTAGFFRNPLWDMNYQEKLKYIYDILSDPYNQERAQSAWALDKRTQQIKEYIVTANAKGMMRFIKRDDLWNSFYSLYYNSVRKFIKRKS